MKNKIWIYETGREVSEILGSGSTRYNVETTTSKEDALNRYNTNPSINYLIRYKRTKGCFKSDLEYWTGEDWAK